MPSFDVVVSCPIHDSFRVQQVAGMFDVPLAEKATERFEVELPERGDDWQIGLVVGPSGSGKSTVARHAFGAAVYGESGRAAEQKNSSDPSAALPFCSSAALIPAWPPDRAVVDCFGDLAVRKVVELFTAVGFGSPPSWVKPYHVLSCGERFRCDLARALSAAFKTPGKAGGCGANPPNSAGTDTSPSAPGSAGGSPLIVYDEFTSVVDRTVAKVCSAAIAKGIRRNNIPCRFVAVTCHYDVAEWLEPDWVLDMATQSLSRRRLRRPTIELEIHRCRLAAWELFKRHHYLTAGLAPQARCYLTTWNDVPVNFCATLPIIAKRRHRRFTRIVTLPDYQGLGIGMRAVAAVAELHRAEGFRINVTSSHPALIRHCQRSPLWKAVNVKKTGTSPASSKQFPHYHNSAGRSVVSFEYVGTEQGTPRALTESKRPHLLDPLRRM
jgi:GNAT superfamily N-acetyltransferase